MSDLRVSPEALYAAAERLRTESARMESALRGLESEGNRLRSGWDGAAQVAFDNAHHQWSVTFEGMKETLRRISTATVDIADGYIDTDKASARRFS